MFMSIYQSAILFLSSQKQCQHNTAGSPTEQWTGGKTVYAKEQQIVCDQHRQGVWY